MPKQRSIRSVPLPKRRRTEDEIDSILYERDAEEEDENVPEEPDAVPILSRRYILWGVASLFVLVLGFSFIGSFSGATVTVTPKVERMTVQHEFTAIRSTEGGDQRGVRVEQGELSAPSSARRADGKLRFEVLPLRETAEVVIAANATKKVTERASGKLVIYNAFSERPQRLIKNTRFESPDGLIYRIGSSVTVPGKRSENGRSIPGSIEATVTADAPGPDYNIALADLTIPGFKNDSARYAGFYARSRTPMTGGFDGTVRIPSEEAVAGARVALSAELESKIAENKQAVVPAGYVLFNGAIQTKERTLPPEERPKNMAAVKQESSGALYIFKKEDILKAIAETVRGGAAAPEIAVPDLQSLQFALVEPPTGNPSEAGTLRFTLTGDIHVVAKYDTEKLKTVLLGKPKAELASALSSFPSIGKADLIIRPFWKRNFPSDPRKVSIEQADVELPEGAAAK